MIRIKIYHLNKRLARLFQILIGHQVDFAATLRKEAGLATMTMGMIDEPHFAEQVIASGEADFVALARALLVDPHWPWYAATVLGEDVAYPPQYLRGYRSRWHRSRHAARPGSQRQD